MNDYSMGDRILHRLALGISLIRRASFDIETLIAPHDRLSPELKHVFICGLARAGTTILMRCFYDSGRFCSLTYRNMPFVLMPNIWKRVSGRFQVHGQARERAHGDGLLVDFDSPEAFEEVFWRTFCGRQYILKDCLKPHDVSVETINRFRTYIASVTASSDTPGQCYLSKNNNNLLRIPAIRRAFPGALIVIPFRDPLQQAFSLFTQHRQFLAMHAGDSFSRDYMCWLGHHEFGAAHKPFSFTGVPANTYQPDDINYWLSLWISTYHFLIETASPGAVFVCYEELCHDPATVLGKLFGAAGIPVEGSVHKSINLQPEKTVSGADAGLIHQARQVYGKMLALSGVS